MASGTLEPGTHYVPNMQAWDRYKNNGGSAELKARTVSAQQDNLVQLTGLPGYWWRVSELSASTPTPQRVEPPAPSPAPSKPMCVIEVPTSRLQSNVCAGDLTIEYEDEEDENCAGEECEECGGEGCTTSTEPLSAVHLLEYLLDDYGHSAESYAEAYSVDAADVDTIYRDLMVLVGGIRHRT